MGRRRKEMNARWEALAEQPKVKWVTVKDQTDEFNTRGKNILVSPRFTHDFDHFLDEVNDKLKPGGPPLRKIYTSAGGTQVRSLSALVNHKDYMALPQKVKKGSHSNASTRKNSKKSSASSEGYHSSEDKNKGKGRLSLLERQALYAKKRSQSEPPTPRGSKSKSPSPLLKPNITKKGAANSKYQAPLPKTKKSTNSTFVSKKGTTNTKKKSPAKKVSDSDDDSPVRGVTPPGKKRMAFRGQYIFVTDDEADSDDSNKSPVKTAKPSKLTAAKSKLTTANSSKLTTAKSTKTTAASRLSRRSAASSTKSTISRSTKVLSRQASDDEYYEDYSNDTKVGKSAVSTRKSSGNHLAPSGRKSFNSTTNSTRRNSVSSRRNSDAGQRKNFKGYNSDKSINSTGRTRKKSVDSDDSDVSRSRISRLSTRRNSVKSRKSSGSRSDSADSAKNTRAASRISKYSKFSKFSKQNSRRDSAASDYSAYDSDKSNRSKSPARKSRADTRRKSTGGSTRYRASSRGSFVSQIPDTPDTKVNTPVDLQKAKEVNEDDYYSEYSDTDSRYGSARSRNYSGISGRTKSNISRRKSR